MIDPNALQAAIYGKLSGIATVTGVYYLSALQAADSAALAAFPYVTFSIPSAVPFDTVTTTGVSSTVQVDVWSRDHSGQCNTIAAAIYAALHRQPLSVTGHVTTEAEAVEMTIDADGITLRAMLRFQILQHATQD